MSRRSSEASRRRNAPRACPSVTEQDYPATCRETPDETARCSARLDAPAARRHLHRAGWVRCAGGHRLADACGSGHGGLLLRGNAARVALLLDPNALELRFRPPLRL